jgi:predicted secreted protein
MMKNLQKVGGIAALTGTATNLLGAVVYATLLLPKGLDSKDSDPGEYVALLAGNQAAMRLWYQIIYLAFGACMIFLSLALHERLKAGPAVLAQAVTIFGLIYAVLVISIGTLSINDLNTVVSLHSTNPAQAATVWSTLKSVETGLGAGGGETIVTGLWFLLVSWAALQARALPRLLNYLGVVTGLAGILYVFLASAGLLAVNAVGLIIWFAWLGIVLLRRSPASTSDQGRDKVLAEVFR